MSVAIDISGQKFGRWTVIRRTGKKSRWEVRCECGTIKEIYISNLKRPNSSCGCFHRERVSTHGASRTAEYNLWRNMIYRCESPQSINWRDYGGRGIKVCARWHDFSNFIGDIGWRPEVHLSIERIDNDGDYEPNNCRWATKKEQARNKRNVKKLDSNITNEELIIQLRQMYHADWASSTRYISLWHVELCALAAMRLEKMIEDSKR